jgi:hypothetical protein
VEYDSSRVGLTIVASLAAQIGARYEHDGTTLSHDLLAILLIFVLRPVMCLF